MDAAQLATYMVATAVLFVLKAVFAFAVTHPSRGRSFPGPDRVQRIAQTVKVEPRRLTRADEPAVIVIDALAKAFAGDPLFVRLFGGTDDDMHKSAPGACRPGPEMGRRMHRKCIRRIGGVGGC